VGGFTLEGRVGTREAAWRHISDLDELARLGGLPPLVCGYRPDATGFGALRGTLLGPVGIRHDFEEHDHGWEWGHRVWVERRIQGPLLRSASYRGSVVPVDGGHVARLEFTAEPRGLAAAPGVTLLTAGLRREWARLLEEPAERPRRQLDGESRAALARWERRGAPGDLVARFQDWVERAPDAELRDLRPSALAAAWGLDTDEVLGWLLEGTTVGLVELFFAVRCPGCSATTARVDRLTRLDERAACGACRRSFLVDLRDHVEVRMVALPRLAPPEQERWATVVPRARSGVRALATIPGRGQRRLEVELGPGRWRLDAGQGHPPAWVEVVRDGPAEARWTVGSASSVRVGPGRSELSVENPGERTVRVVLVDEEVTGGLVSAARLATLPTYRGVFGTQTLAPGVYLGVSRVVLLVTDLLSSQTLYTELGDRRALAFVDGHLRELERLVGEGGGVRVKTVGDSLVAAFDAPGAAAAVAMGMQEHYARWAGGQGVTEVPDLRVGVSAGPALAARSDASGLDWSGGTANRAVMAARSVDGGEVGLTATVAAFAPPLTGWRVVQRGELTVLQRGGADGSALA